MSAFLQREMQALKVKILELGNIVENKFQMITKALLEKDAKVAEKIKFKDYEIDEIEVEIEEEALKLLALYQPVAIDLRVIVAIIKINNDLERIGDIIVNIANRIQVIADNSHVKKFDNFINYEEMIEKAGKMLKLSLDCLIDLDADLAKKVLVKDDKIDQMLADVNKSAKQELLKAENPEEAAVFINMLLTARHLERLADHTTNIAEEIIYMVDGEIIRHEPKPEE